MDSVGSNADERMRVAASQIDQLDRENIRLTNQLKEVMKMNSHWQRYDGQREEHVFELTKNNRELRNKVDELQRTVIELGENKGRETREESWKNNAKEVERATPDDKEEEVAALSDKIVELKERITELEIGDEKAKKEEIDQVALLREQLNVCVEDFKQERRDRERIHKENLKLREHLALAEKQVGGRFIDTNSK